MEGKEKGVLYELGKEHFRELLKRSTPNLVIGDELKFGIRFIGEDGSCIHEVIETINKIELEDEK